MLQEKFLATANGTKGVVHIRDEIGPDWAGMISDETIVAFLTANPKLDTIELQINSPGGDCFTAIFSASCQRRASCDYSIGALKEISMNTETGSADLVAATIILKSFELLEQWKALCADYHERLTVALATIDELKRQALR